MKTYNIELTKEELEGLLTQIGSRIDSLKILQKEAAHDGDVDRVLELEKFMQPIISGKDKMMDSLFK